MDWIGNAFQSILRKIASIPNPKVFIRTQSLPYYNSCKSPQPQLLSTNWMQYIADDRSVSSLSIPGTHNSFTYHTKVFEASFYTQCQSWTIYEQLQAGIRYLDIKVNCGKDIYTANQTQYEKLQEEIKQISKFLKEYTSQFVVIGFKINEGKEDPSQGILDLFKNKIDVILSRKIPKVGDLRGKVWIISGSQVKFQAHPTYELPAQSIGTLNHPRKKTERGFNLHVSSREQQRQTLEQMKQKLISEILADQTIKEKLLIHLLSASQVGRMNMLYPCDLAKDENGFSFTLYQALKARSMNFLGIIVMDFPGQGLIHKIIECNFK